MKQLKQLLLARYLFQAGETEMKREGEFSPSLAISFFQDSIETLIWTVAKEVDVEMNGKDRFDFESSWTLIQKKSDKLMPYRGKMIDLNKARVGFKHNGNLVAKTTSISCYVHAEDFLRDTSVMFFGVNIFTLSDADSVTDMDVRNYIKCAELAFQAGNIKDTLSACANAFLLVNEGLSKAIAEPVVIEESIDNIGTIMSGMAANAALVGKMQQSLFDLRALVVSSASGMPYVDYLNFKRCIPYLNRRNQDIVEIDFTAIFEGKQITLAEAGFCVRYIINFSLGVQKMLGGAGWGLL